jgi:hypothetical protein
MGRFPASLLLVLLVPALWAQQPASPSSKAQARKKSPSVEAGATSDGLYHNPSFGFSYKLPFGWVDRTREMQGDSAGVSKDSAKSLLLLAIFERPPEATGDTINSAVVITAERLSAYSGMKTAVDYFGPLTELATAKGFQAESDPHEFSVGATHLVRGDFSKARGTLTMHQSSLVMLEKGYAVSFTFIGGSEDEMNELIEKLSFAKKPSTATSSPQRGAGTLVPRP